MRQRVALLLGLLLMACSSAHVLNEARAKVLISDALKAKQYQAPIDEITALMRRSHIDYGSAAGKTGDALAINKLLEAGLVTKTEELVTYPNLSGSWRSTFGSGYTNVFSLEAVPNTNSLTGTCQTDQGAFGRTNGLTTTAVTGTIENNNEVTIRGNLFCTGYDFKSIFQFKQDGSGAYLQEPATQLDRYGISQRTDQRTFAIGRSVPSLEVRWYTYAFTPAVNVSSQTMDASLGAIMATGSLSKNTRTASVGQYEVTGVSSLQLVDQTHAVAAFAFGVVLDKFGAIVLRGAKVDGHGQATFAQKPDKTWILTDIR